MRSDGGVLYTQIEGLLPQFVQQKHPQFTKFVEKYYEFMELNLLTILVIVNDFWSNWLIKSY